MELIGGPDCGPPSPAPELPAPPREPNDPGPNDGDGGGKGGGNQPGGIGEIFENSWFSQIQQTASGTFSLGLEICLNANSSFVWKSLLEKMGKKDSSCWHIAGLCNAHSHG